MSENKNRIPILRFLNKHKWRIIVPILITTVYFGLPRYFHKPFACQYYLFITSSQNAAREQLSAEVSDISSQVLSDESLRGLIAKYDLFTEERKSGIDDKLLIEKMRAATRIEPELENTANGAMVYVWAHFWDIDSQKVTAVSNEVAARFEEQSNFRVMKYIAPPYDYNVWRGWALFGSALQGATFSLLLILIWEIPNLFYSQKTKETIFEPLKSDWQSELIEAKLNNRIWGAAQINMYYSYAFLVTLLQKSPIGNLMEFVGKFTGRNV